MTEARAASALNHPNICTIHEVAEDEGRMWIVMEYVEGQLLNGSVPSGGLPPHTVVDYGVQIADALAHAHERGVIHRDLKGANIAVTPEGRLKVLDFGLARRSVTDAGEDLTRSHQSLSAEPAIAGTLAYMAPEVLTGAQADESRDIWSLGVLLDEMASGALPFQGRSGLALAAAILHEPVPPLPAAVPAALGSIVRQCLEKEPARRYRQAADVERALEAGRESRRPARRTSSWIVAAAILIVGAGLAGAFWPRVSREAASVSRAEATPVPAFQPRRAVAVLGFKNLSGQARSAWLSTALSEMLTTELAAGEQLRAIPGEKVARMKRDLTLGQGDSFAADTLARIRSHLGTDLVVLGSYLTVGGRIRFDVRLQDAAAGETIASIAETGTDAELFEIVSRIGARLRERIGVAGLSSADAARVRASRPATNESARLYADGLEQLRVFEAQAARTLLEQAVAADPGLSLAHSALAEAWSSLGYDAKARESARRAFELSSHLNREDRLRIEGRYRETTNERDKAVEAYQALVDAFPDNVEYRPSARVRADDGGARQGCAGDARHGATAGQGRRPPHRPSRSRPNRSPT